MSINYRSIFMSVAVLLLSSGTAVLASQMDDRIETSARNSYVYKTYLKDDVIRTTSKDGVVTLSGVVMEESHISLAQEIVANLPGVKRVDNQLTLKGERPEENSDGWLSMKVKALLLFNRNVSGLKTQVYVNDGIVTLKGEADSQAQKDLTGEYAKDVQGIKEVRNEMTIAKVEAKSQNRMDEMIDDASITAQVKMAFLSHHSTSAFKTGVQTVNGVVTLSGDVTSSAGKDMATKVAGDVNGVKNVINNMTIRI